MQRMGGSRRQFLFALSALGGLVGGAGCLRRGEADSPVSLGWFDEEPAAVVIDATAVSDEELTRSLARSMTGDEAAIAEQLRTRASVTKSSRGPMVRTGVQFVDGSTVFEFEVDAVGADSGYQAVVSLDPVSSQDLPPSIESDLTRQDYESLPEVDREQIFEANGWETGILDGPVRTGVSYTQSEAEQSAIVPSPSLQTVAWTDHEVSVELVSVDELSFTAYTYRRREDDQSAAAIGASLRDTYGHTVDELTEEEAAIFQTAIEEPDGYRLIDEEPGPALDGLLTAVATGHALPAYFDAPDETAPSGPNGRYLVDPRDTTYLVAIAIDGREHGYSMSTP